MKKLASSALKGLLLCGAVVLCAAMLAACSGGDDTLDTSPQQTEEATDSAEGIAKALVTFGAGKSADGDEITFKNYKNITAEKRYNIDIENMYDSAGNALYADENLFTYAVEYSYKNKSSDAQSLFGYIGADTMWIYIQKETVAIDAQFGGNDADGYGISYCKYASITISADGKNLTLQKDGSEIVYTKSVSKSDTDNITVQSTLDIYTMATYSMKIGETVTLKPSWDIGDECYYEITDNEFNAISLSANAITAETVGTATVKMTANDNPSKTGYCTITVTSDSFSGNGIEYKLLGTWYETDSKSYITFNADYSGYMKVYLNDSVVQDVTFTFKAYGNSYGKFLTLSNANDYLNKDYTITSVNDTTLRLNGNLAFGKPNATTWYKR